MKLIAAVDRNWGIGRNNGLLYSIPEDMRFFRETTMGHPVICGRKTLESFPGGKPLHGRRHFVLTHSDMPKTDVITPVASLDELKRLLAEDRLADEAFVIGGASVYRALYRYCTTALVTKIDADTVVPDVFFPDLDRDPAFFIRSQSGPMISKNGLSFFFLEYENRSPLSL